MNDCGSNGKNPECKWNTIMAIISADKDTSNTKLILQICKYNKKAFFPLAISANWLEHPPISKGSHFVSSDKEIRDSAFCVWHF